MSRISEKSYRRGFQHGGLDNWTMPWAILDNARLMGSPNGGAWTNRTQKPICGRCHPPAPVWMWIS